jgi:hypothetical protein
MSDGSGHVRLDKCQNVGWDLVTPKSGVRESWDARLGCQCGGYGQALDAARAGAKCQGQATTAMQAKRRKLDSDALG